MPNIERDEKLMYCIALQFKIDLICLLSMKWPQNCCGNLPRNIQLQSRATFPVDKDKLSKQRRDKNDFLTKFSLDANKNIC